MIDIDIIIKQWENDSEIDDMRLDDASRDSAKLHSKYLSLVSTNRLELRKRELDMNVLLKDKWLWYNGKMDKATIEAHGWSYDAMNGLKVLKGDMNRFYDSDPDIQKLQAKIEYLKNSDAILKEIMDTLRFRGQTIKNMVEWRKFTSGG